ncbi:DNA cytosine methyltransferase [Achromobacter sp. DH1f]|uniref:DNA cytosine methyltransferase n=1 Tax=Achromobacter sp. DH1f TaxID=1397275 RepID=UPI001E49E63F|nr:DNA cytosine methyltransferase [Achromobacter sp. DH1f]
MKCMAAPAATEHFFHINRQFALRAPLPTCDARPARRARGNYRPTRSRRSTPRLDPRNLSLDLGDELIIDNFAGGGGTSEGLEQAFGRPVDIAINHDPEALAMHAINHPHTLHLCESVWDVDPIKVTNNRPVGLVWLSPDCKHFSKAKGGTPVDKRIRGLAWVTMRWAAKCKPRTIILENVEEFQTWGPLIQRPDGKWYPDPTKKGKTFQSFVRQLRGHGYEVEWRELRASDHDTPTSRKRFFLVARRDGLPVIWPQASHASPESIAVKNGLLRPWRTAAECIDFSIHAASIFDRDRALAYNTLRRVAKGTWRHVFTNETPFIVPQAADGGGDEGLSLTPFIAGSGGPEYAGRPVSAAQPLGTQTTENHRALVAPVIAPLRGTQEAHLQADSAIAPVSTISAGGTHHALTSAHLITIGYGERAGQEPRAQNAVAPLGTVVTANKHAMVAAHLTHLTHHGDRPGTTPAGLLPTITGANRGEQVMVSTHLELPHTGIHNEGVPSAYGVNGARMAPRSQQKLVSAYMIKYYGEGGQWAAANDPVHTITTKDRVGLVETIQMPLDALPPAMLAKAKKCARFFFNYLPEHFPHKTDVIVVRGMVLVDMTLRMLVPRELYSAQGFPTGYVINEIPDPKQLFVDGRQVEGDPRLLPRVRLSKTAQVRMCGNSVCPPLARALIMANFAHEEGISQRLARVVRNDFPGGGPTFPRKVLGDQSLGVVSIEPIRWC